MINNCRSERLPSSAGISPVNWLPERYNTWRRESLPSSAGISPVSWLPERYNTWRRESLPNSEGISPVNWFKPSCKSLRTERFPSAAGISPVSSFSWKNNGRLLAYGSKYGLSKKIELASSLLLRNNPITRGLESESEMVTPCHWSMGRSVLQFSEAVPAKVSLAAKRAAQSATRPGYSGSDTAGLLVHTDVCTWSQNGNSTCSRSFSGTSIKTFGIHPLSWL